MIKPISYTTLFAVCAAIAQTLQAQGTGGDTHDHRLFPCMEDGLKSGDTGCQLLGKIMVQQFPDSPLFWCLNRFPTRNAAEAAKVHNSLVADAESRSWLFSFGPKNGAPKSGEVVASICPLPLTLDKLPKASLYQIVAVFAWMTPST